VHSVDDGQLARTLVDQRVDELIGQPPIITVAPSGTSLSASTAVATTLLIVPRRLPEE
jgi:hypothetical protein